MKYTVNYNLKKPEGSDAVNIDDFNINADILDTEINSLNEQVDTLVTQDNSLRAQINSLVDNKADLVNGKVPSIQLPNIEVPVQSVNSKTGAVVLTKSDIGLGNVDNTVDSAKAVLSATKLATARTINGVAFDGTVNITVADGTKAPTNHASTGTGYGLGTTVNYGHVKVRNDLLASAYADGESISSYQAYLLNERNKYKVVELTSSGTWVAPAGVYEVDVVLIGGGGGGAGGTSSLNYGYNSSNQGPTYGRSGRCGLNGEIISIAKLKVVPGQSYPVVIGAGGNAGNGGAYMGLTSYYGPSNYPPNTYIGYDGVDGGDTSIFGIVAKGGFKGQKEFSNNNTADEVQTKYGTPIVLTSSRDISTGSNGSAGVGFNIQYPEADSTRVPTIVTGGGKGGRGGWSDRTPEVGSNAIGYGSGGGGGGGGGGKHNNGGLATVTQAGGKGGNGKQGIILIGYF